MSKIQKHTRYKSDHLEQSVNFSGGGVPINLLQELHDLVAEALALFLSGPFNRVSKHQVKRVTRYSFIYEACLTHVLDRLNKFNYQHANATFEGWLYRLVSNKCIDEFRKAKNRPEQIPTEGFTMHFEFPWGEADIEKHYQLEVVVKAVDEMEGTYKQVLSLAYLEELSYDEIACRTHLKKGSVGRTLNRAKHRLRRNISRSA